MIAMPHWPMPIGPLSPEDGVTRTREVLARLGNPHERLPPVVHVAGTNGKGSTIAMVRAMLETAGRKVHVYTSPHLTHFNERLVLAGAPIADEPLRLLMEECRQKAGDLRVSFFEGSTAAALLAFSRTPADILLMECGCGGRFDATNVLPNPLLTAITPISLDHAEFLGGGLDVIAWHKGGILKPGVPCVVASQPGEALPVLEAVAEQQSSPLLQYGDTWGVVAAGERGWTYADEDGQWELPLPALSGAHQLQNAATAVCIARHLKELSPGLEAVSTGLLSVQWPGRMERVTVSKVRALVPDSWEVWVDAAHNPSGMAAVAGFLQEDPARQACVIVGVSRGRNPAELLGPLRGVAEHILTVQVQNEPDSLPADALAEQAADAGFTVTACESLEEAFKVLTQRCNGPARVVCCGSMYLRQDLAAMQ